MSPVLPCPWVEATPWTRCLQSSYLFIFRLLRGSLTVFVWNSQQILYKLPTFPCLLQEHIWHKRVQYLPRLFGAVNIFAKISFFFLPLLNSLLFVWLIMFSLGVKRKVHLRSSLLSSLFSEACYIKRQRRLWDLHKCLCFPFFLWPFLCCRPFSLHIAYWLAYIYSAPWHVLLPQQPATTPLVCWFFCWLSPVCCPTMHCSLPPTSAMSRLRTASAETAAMWITDL